MTKIKEVSVLKTRLIYSNYITVNNSRELMELKKVLNHLGFTNNAGNKYNEKTAWHESCFPVTIDINLGIYTKEEYSKSVLWEDFKTKNLVKVRYNTGDQICYTIVSDDLAKDFFEKKGSCVIKLYEGFVLYVGRLKKRADFEALSSVDIILGNTDDTLEELKEYVRFDLKAL